MQSKIRVAWLTVAGAALLVGAGCGDGDGEGGAKSSGVASSKPLSEVTDAEATQICEWGSDASYAPSDKETCTFRALFFSSTPAECEAFVAQCLKEGPRDEEEEESCDSAKNDLPDDCTATVAELEACIRDFNAALRDFFAGASCDDAGMTATGDPAAAPPPASCAAVEKKCPGLYGDDDTSGAGADSGDLGSP